MTHTRCFFFACLMALTACDASVNDLEIREWLTQLTTDDQVVEIGQRVTLSLRVANASGAALVGQTVLWTLDGSGNIDETSSLTGANGVASAELTVGQGRQRVTARIEGGTGLAIFTMHGCQRCGEWSHVPLSASGRTWASAVAMDDRMLIIGGFDGFTSTNAIDVFEPGATRLRRTAQLPFALGGATTVVLDGTVYIMGGFADEFLARGSPTVLAFDPESGRSEFRAPLEQPRFLAAGAVLNGRIYLTGGRVSCDFDGFCPGPLNRLDIYDPLTNRWTQGPRMREARALAGAAVLDGKLYVAGGTSGELWWLDQTAAIASVEVYDPATDSWTLAGPLPVAGPVHLATWNGVLYALVEVVADPAAPRSNDYTKYSRVYEYDPAQHTWTRLSNGPQVGGAAVAAVAGKLHVFGGWIGDPTYGLADISNDLYILTR